MEYVRSYKPKNPGNWEDAFSRAASNPRDDSHLIKFIRAVANGERICGNGEGSKNRRMVGRDVWLQTAHMALDAKLEYDGVAVGHDKHEDTLEEVKIAAQL